tara:strand:+ start:772 stop:1155 length:384 start_codon:yes stop_codon:yes gene_type:complete
MEFIRQIYNRFCKLFGRRAKNESDEPNIIFSIDIDDEYVRHINVYIPEDIDIDKITELANAYSESLLDMRSGKVVQQLLYALESSIDKTNPNEVLLFENILSLFVQSSQIRSDSTDPMIEPLSVFKK